MMADIDTELGGETQGKSLSDHLVTMAVDNQKTTEQRLAAIESEYASVHGRKAPTFDQDLAEKLAVTYADTSDISASQRVKNGFFEIESNSKVIEVAIENTCNDFRGFTQNTIEWGLTGDPERVRAAMMIRDKLREMEDIKIELYNSSVEAFYYLHAKDLIDISDNYRENGGRLIFAPFVVEAMDAVLDRLENGRIAFLHGETGTGKTELAREAARRFTGGKEPELVRSHNDMDSTELTGHMSLAAGPDGSTITEYIMGPVYRAAADGNVVILDEANYIPPGVLANLNDIMVKRPGDMIPVQEDGIAPIKVQQGFGIILTANIGSKYESGRHEFDDATINRLGTVLYDYLPQTREGNIQDAAPEQKQLFQTLLTGIMDKSGRIVAQSDDFERFWRLAQLARTTQESFSGKLKLRNMSVGGAEAQDVELKNALTNRDCLMILKEYIIGLHKPSPKTLDEILFDQLIKGTLDDDQKRELYFQAQEMGFFGEGWQKLETHDEAAFNSFVPDKPHTVAIEKLDIFGFSIMDVVDAIYKTDKMPTNFAYLGDGQKFGTDESVDIEEMEVILTQFMSLRLKYGRMIKLMESHGDGVDAQELRDRSEQLEKVIEHFENTGEMLR